MMYLTRSRVGDYGYYVGTNSFRTTFSQSLRKAPAVPDALGTPDRVSADTLG